MSRNYSFSLDGRCSGCGKILYTVLVDGEEFSVNDDGVLCENEDTDLILGKPDPVVSCGYCNEDLSYDVQEE